MKHLIFAYGSLISKKSRNITSNVNDGFPVILKGYKRGWYFQMKNYGMSALAIIKDVNNFCNGILFELNEDQLIDYDKREKGYQRIELSKNNIDSKLFFFDKKIWTYIIRKKNIPNKDFPIVQSYLDIVIDGCLGYGSKFTDEFINTTDLWDGEWINDRQNPRYPRYMKNLQINKIDSLLRKKIK